RRPSSHRTRPASARPRAMELDATPSTVRAEPAHRRTGGGIPMWVTAVGAALLAVGFRLGQHAGAYARREPRPEGKAQGADAARALDPGHGRLADTPSQIPLRGWKDILLRAYRNIGKDRVIAIAAGVTFYSILALFPAIAALVSLYGLFADPATIASH